MTFGGPGSACPDSTAISHRHSRSWQNLSQSRRNRCQPHEFPNYRDWTFNRRNGNSNGNLVVVSESGLNWWMVNGAHHLSYRSVGWVEEWNPTHLTKDALLGFAWAQPNLQYLLSGFDPNSQPTTTNPEYILLPTTKQFQHGQILDPNKPHDPTSSVDKVRLLQSPSHTIPLQFCPWIKWC